MAGRRGGGEGFIHPRAPRVRTNPYFRRIHKRGVRNPVSNIGTNEPPISATRTERVPWTGTRCPPNRTSLRPSLPPRPSLPSHHPVRRLTESETRLGPTENAARKLGTNRERGVTETARARASKEEKGGRKTETGRERERKRYLYGGALAPSAAPNGKPGTYAILCRPVPSDPTYFTLPLRPSVNAQMPRRVLTRMEANYRSLSLWLP